MSYTLSGDLGCGIITRLVTVFLPSRMARTIAVLNSIGFILPLIHIYLMHIK